MKATCVKWSSVIHPLRGTSHLTPHMDNELVSFEDLTVYFTLDKWVLLNPSKKKLYHNVMQETLGAWPRKEKKDATRPMKIHAKVLGEI